jgi:RNA-splicing ligase RtcB
MITEKVKVYAKTVEDTAATQIKEMSECEAYKDCTVRIMPDCHAGAGCTIGTVIALGGRIVPNTVGVDIGCGMLVANLGKIDIDMERLDDVVNNEVPSGFNIHEHVQSATKLPEMLYCREAIDVGMALKSIGSLGGGNHFIEVDVNEKGDKFLVIHSGSRNLGKRVCEYWQKRALEYCKKLGVNEQEIIARLKAEGRQKEIAQAIRQAKENAPNVNKDLTLIGIKIARDNLEERGFAAAVHANDAELVALLKRKRHAVKYLIDAKGYRNIRNAEDRHATLLLFCS